MTKGRDYPGHGFRIDVLAAVRDLGVTNVRWPGGNFVSGYHWADGIGPDWPRRAELAWASEESNRFGTDEFLAWCAAAGVEPALGPRWHGHPRRGAGVGGVLQRRGRHLLRCAAARQRAR